MILSEQVRRTKELMGLLNEQEGPRPGDDTSIVPVAIGPEVEERFTPIKGQVFTGVGKADVDVPDRLKVQRALEAAEDDVINNIFEKIGGTVVKQPDFVGEMTVKWEDGTEDTFSGRKYWEDISEHGDRVMTGKIGKVWVNRKTGEEVEAPKWINKERIRNPFRAMKRDRFLKKHKPIETSTVTYKIR